MHCHGPFILLFWCHEHVFLLDLVNHVAFSLSLSWFHLYIVISLWLVCCFTGGGPGFWGLVVVRVFVVLSSFLLAC